MLKCPLYAVFAGLKYDNKERIMCGCYLFRLCIIGANVTR